MPTQGNTYCSAPLTVYTLDGMQRKDAVTMLEGHYTLFMSRYGLDENPKPVFTLSIVRVAVGQNLGSLFRREAHVHQLRDLPVRGRGCLSRLLVLAVAQYLNHLWRLCTCWRLRWPCSVMRSFSSSSDSTQDP